MPWYFFVLLFCLVIGPFDALYMHIKAEKRRDALRWRKEEKEKDSSRHDDGR